jgi:phosphoribosylformylglycinamidine synthase
VSEGGLFQTLCESAYPNELGFSVQLASGIRPDAFLFGESQSRVLVSVSMEQQSAFLASVGDFPCSQVGVVTSGEVFVEGQSWGPIGVWKQDYDLAIHQLMSAETTV